MSAPRTTLRAFPPPVRAVPLLRTAHWTRSEIDGVAVWHRWEPAGAGLVIYGCVSRKGAGWTAEAHGRILDDQIPSFEEARTLVDRTLEQGRRDQGTP